MFTQPLPRAEGKTASEDVNARFMLEVVRFRGDLMTVFLVNVCTRRVSTKTIADKSTASVLAAVRVLIERLNSKPKVLSTDDGLEIRCRTLAARAGHSA